MKKYLTNHEYKTIGIIKETWNKKYILYYKYYNSMGYYDEIKGQIYDAYGNLAGEGNLLQDLLYMPHKLKFPLPLPEQISFTQHKIEKFVMPLGH